MTDFTQMMDSPPPADWTEAGIFRAAFLAVFDAEDRAVLRQAGKILALSAIAGDPESDPADHYRGAVQDAQALAVYLEEVRELATEAEPDHPAAAVAKDAEHWRRELEDVVAGMEADLRRLLKAGEPAPDPVARLLLGDPCACRPRGPLHAPDFPANLRPPHPHNPLRNRPECPPVWKTPSSRRLLQGSGATPTGGHSLAASKPGETRYAMARIWYALHMRTTISLEDRLAEAVRARAAEEGRSVSAWIAAILDDATKRPRRREERPFRLVTVGGTGVRDGVNLDRPRELEIQEDEAARANGR